MNGRSLQIAVVALLCLILTGFFLRSNYLLRQEQPLTRLASTKLDAPTILTPAKIEVGKSLNHDPFHLVAVKPKKSAGKSKSRPSKAKSGAPKAKIELLIGKKLLKVLAVFISKEESGAIFSVESQPGEKTRGKTKRRELWVPEQGKILGSTLLNVEPDGVRLSVGSDQEPVLLKIFSLK